MVFGSRNRLRYQVPVLQTCLQSGADASERDVQKGLRSSRTASLYKSVLVDRSGIWSGVYWTRCIERACSDGAKCLRDSVPLGCVDPVTGVPSGACGTRDDSLTRHDVSNRLAWTVRSDESALLALLVVQACLNGPVCQISVLTLSVVWACSNSRECSQNRAGLLV